MLFWNFNVIVYMHTLSLQYCHFTCTKRDMNIYTLTNIKLILMCFSYGWVKYLAWLCKLCSKTQN